MSSFLCCIFFLSFPSLYSGSALMALNPVLTAVCRQEGENSLVLIGTTDEKGLFSLRGQDDLRGLKG